jgi:RNA polymerase sigma factor (TIGR02999 family)
MVDGIDGEATASGMRTPDGNGPSEPVANAAAPPSDGAARPLATDASDGGPAARCHTDSPHTRDDAADPAPPDDREAPEPPGRDELRSIDPELYEELREIAARYIRKEGVASRQAGPGTTSLVSEVWLRLARSDRNLVHDRQHLLALASIVARRTLVDAAKARLATRRGGGLRPASLASEVADGSTDPAELVAVDELLTILAERYPRAARALEMRMFGGFSPDLIANTLGISPTSAKRDIAFSRAWIAREFDRSSGGDGT